MVVFKLCLIKVDWESDAVVRREIHLIILTGPGLHLKAALQLHPHLFLVVLV